MPQPCATCGRSIDEHNRHVRFRLPEPVLGRETTPGMWMSHDDPNTSVMMQVPRVGAFVRALLPVGLDGGYTVTFGVWLSVHPDDLQRAFRAWWEPEYRSLVLDGLLANVLPVWDALGLPVTASVIDPDATPYITASSDKLLADVLTQQWPHDELFDALP